MALNEMSLRFVCTVCDPVLGDNGEMVRHLLLPVPVL